MGRMAARCDHAPASSMQRDQMYKLTNLFLSVFGVSAFLPRSPMICIAYTQSGLVFDINGVACALQCTALASHNSREYPASCAMSACLSRGFDCVCTCTFFVGFERINRLRMLPPACAVRACS